MKKKQTLAVLLAAAMVLSMPVGVYAEELTPEQGQQQQEVELFAGAGTPDYENPELHSVKVNKAEAQENEEIVIEISATDDVSQISFVKFVFTNNSTKEEMEFYKTVDEETDLKGENNYQFVFTIPSNQAIGQYNLTQVVLQDNAERYGRYGEGYLPLPNPAILSIVETVSEDIEAPKLLDLEISNSSVEAPGNLILYAKVSDDASGVSSVIAKFRNVENEREITAQWSSFRTETVKEGKVELDIEIQALEESGKFVLEEVSLEDDNGHWAYYFTRQTEHPSEPYLPQEISFTVINSSIGDSEAPVLSSIYFDGKETEVEAPGYIDITVAAEDKGAGIDHIIANFVNRTGDRIIYANAYGEDPCKLRAEIPSYEPSGLFELRYVTLVDNLGNRVYYYSSSEETTNNPTLPNELSFYVHNTDESANEGDIFTSTLNSQLAEKISEMDNGKTAYISYGRNDVLPAEVFEAIKGTNKTIVLESAGIQWIFNGQSITDENIKEINLNTTIEEKYSSDSEASEELPWEQKAIILSFEDNGPLPGPAKIRVKMDYAFQNYVGAENLYVYYYDNTNKKFELVGEKLTITDDEYLEFTITHNSDFVITSGPIKTQEEENPDNPNPPVNPGEDDKPVTPSTPSNPTTPSRPNSSTTTAPGTPINYESEKPDPADEQAVEAYNFWQNTKREIRVYERAGSLRVYVPADVTYMPASVMETLQVENVPVVLQWQGHRIEIPAGKAQPKQPLKAYWPMKTLCELYNA